MFVQAIDQLLEAGPVLLSNLRPAEHNPNLITYPPKAVYLSAGNVDTVETTERAENVLENPFRRRSRDRTPPSDQKRSRERQRSRDRRSSGDRTRSQNPRRGNETQSRSSYTGGGHRPEPLNNQPNKRSFTETVDVFESEEAAMMRMAGIPVGFGGKPKKNRAAAFIVESEQQRSQLFPANSNYGSSAIGSSLFPISF